MVSYLIAAMPVSSLLNVFPLLRWNEWGIKTQDVITVMLCVGALFALFRSVRCQRLIFPFLLCLAVYYCAIFAAPVLYPYGDWKWKFIARYALVLSWGVIVVALLDTERGLRRLLGAIPVSGSIVGVWSIYEYLDNPRLQRIAAYFSAATGEGFEGQASFNEIGALHGLSICLLTSLLFQKLSRAYRLFWTTLVLLNVAGLFLTASRSALLATAVGELIILLHLARLSRKRARRMLVAGIGVAVIGVVSFLLLAALRDRGFSIRVAETFDSYGNPYTSAASRFTSWQICLEFAIHNPTYLLFGLGPGNLMTDLYLVTADSYFFDHLMGEGIVGVGALLMVVVLPLRSLVGRSRSSPVAIAGIVTAAFAGVVSLTGNTLIDPMFGSIVYAVIYGAYRIAQPDESYRSLRLQQA
jgi:hypothetical protein